ncbi:MAG: DNA-binding protein [Candidatus Brocadiia bacterium]
MAREVYVGEGAHVIKLENGEDLLRGLEAGLAERGVHDGVITCGIGSTTGAHVHVVKSTDLPPGNVFFRHEDEPFDVVSMQGYVMDGRVHAHISFARAEDGAQIGGHLEEGCPVLTFCIVTVVETGPLGELDTYAS